MSESSPQDQTTEAGGQPQPQAESQPNKARQKWLMVFGAPGTPGTVRWIVGIVMALFVVLLLNWAGAREAERVLKEEKARGLNGLSVVLRPEFLNPNRTRLEKVAQDLVQSGVYEVVVFADAEGRVLATTDQRYAREDLEIREREFAGMFTATVRIQGDRIIAERGVHLAGNRVEGNSRIGWILVESAE